MVFPEGTRGTAKLFKERYSLVHFGSGFMRLAMKMKTPIVPFAFLGGGEAIPTVANAYTLGRIVGVPYVPITPWLLPAPLPAKLEIHYSAPMSFEGSGSEEDEVVQHNVERVKERIASLIELGRKRRTGEL
jgi:1-acyl-sn-glycerol-3-phosphate acyltransferase